MKAKMESCLLVHSFPVLETDFVNTEQAFGRTGSG
jgi:hypothetical protein